MLKNRAKNSPDFLDKRAAWRCRSSIKNKKEIKIILKKFLTEMIGLCILIKLSLKSAAEP